MAVQPGLCRTRSETEKLVFSCRGPFGQGQKFPSDPGCLTLGSRVVLHIGCNVRHITWLVSEWQKNVTKDVKIQKWLT